MYNLGKANFFIFGDDVRLLALKHVRKCCHVGSFVSIPNKQRLILRNISSEINIAVESRLRHMSFDLMPKIWRKFGLTLI